MNHIIDKRDYSLQKLNTFGIDARCRRYVDCWGAEAVQRFLAERTADDEPMLIIGGGSNLLLTHDWPGTVVRAGIDHFEIRRHDGVADVIVGAGVPWDTLVEICVPNKVYGLECLSLIPGDVGAAAVQNIGAYGSEAKDYIHKIEAIEIATGKSVEIDAADCHYAYRSSRFKGEWKGRYIITYVHFRLSLAFTPNLGYGNIRQALDEAGIAEPTAQELRDTVVRIRREKLPDPALVGSAGSFFMNPIVPREKYDEIAARYERVPHYDIDEANVKIPAGWMIEQCGWKGKRVGNAGVWPRQALVLVNYGGATGKEIVDLSDNIRNDVREKFGVEIKPEVNIV